MMMYQCFVGLCVYRFVLLPYQEYERKRQIREKRRMFTKYTQQRRQEALVRYGG